MATAAGPNNSNGNAVNGGADPDRDLGFGGRLAQAQARMLNRDGSFNVVRGGLAWRQLFHPYHYLLTISWPVFFVLVIGAYGAINAVFAWLYMGFGTLGNSGGGFDDAFYFSVQTFGTIGYGKLTPEGTAANVLVSIEALLSLLGSALVTGLLFARFSRPSAKVVFSEQAVMAPYPKLEDGKGRALMFRMANGRAANLSEVRASVTMSWKNPGTGQRSFHALKLERDRVTFLALQWVVVHPIDEASPFHGVTEAAFHAAEPEVLVLVSAVDEAFFQSASTRTSYKGREIVWGAKFRDVYETQPDGRLFLDVRRMSEVERVELREIS
jgi:inward rectifier potassium channel